MFEWSSFDWKMADFKTVSNVSEPTHPPLNEGDSQAIDHHIGVKRGIKTRHLSMMAIDGIIGPVGSGGETYSHCVDPNRQLVIV